MNKREVFIDLLGEWFARRELESDRTQSTLKKLHDDYDVWVNKYDKAK